LAHIILSNLVKIEPEDVVHLSGSGHYFDGKQRRECADEWGQYLLLTHQKSPRVLDAPNVEIR